MKKKTTVLFYLGTHLNSLRKKTLLILGFELKRKKEMVAPDSLIIYFRKNNFLFYGVGDLFYFLIQCTMNTHFRNKKKKNDLPSTDVKKNSNNLTCLLVCLFQR